MPRGAGLWFLEGDKLTAERPGLVPRARYTHRSTGSSGSTRLLWTSTGRHDQPQDRVARRDRLRPCHHELRLSIGMLTRWQIHLDRSVEMNVFGDVPESLVARIAILVVHASDRVR
jgi:hypothetical protein